MRIMLLGKDYRANNSSRKEKMSAKSAKDVNFHAIEKYQQALKQATQSYKLNDKELRVLTNIVYFEKIEADKLLLVSKLDKMDAEIKSLVADGLIAQQSMGMLGSFYTLSEKGKQALSGTINSLNGQFPKISKGVQLMDKKLEKLDNGLVNKTEKLNEKITAAKAAEIDASKQSALDEKSKKLIEKFTQKRAEKVEKVQDE